MSITEHKYNLADSDILTDVFLNIKMMIWRPEARAVVIGNSNKAVNTVDIPNAEKDGVSVYKRNSGGESVVLTENMLIISIAKNIEKFGNSKEMFNQYNNLIIEGLSKLGIKNLGLKGISDIAIGEKKILGSAMYRNKDRSFYHAVLNVSEDIDIITRYLRHPEREPDYRSGRSHKEFVTSISKEHKKFEFNEIKTILENVFSEHFGKEIEISEN
ncbi:MAG: lipoate--protein ligase family protein [Chlorobi bacterium]|nr:lipoate--protein ligase family protein [Chlorobiota bacterium]